MAKNTAKQKHCHLSKPALVVQSDLSLAIYLFSSHLSLVTPGAVYLSHNLRGALVETCPLYLSSQQVEVVEGSCEEQGQGQGDGGASAAQADLALLQNTGTLNQNLRQKTQFPW